MDTSGGGVEQLNSQVISRAYSRSAVVCVTPLTTYKYSCQTSSAMNGYFLLFPQHTSCYHRYLATLWIIQKIHSGCEVFEYYKMEMYK